jgi:hypothetical protein
MENPQRVRDRAYQIGYARRCVSGRSRMIGDKMALFKKVDCLEAIF